MFITFSPFEAIVAKGSEERTLHCSVTRKGDCNLSHSLIILYQIEHIMSSFFTINLLIGKGIEPHPTDGYHSVSFSNDIETHGASTISTPVMPCESSRFASPLSTQHNILYRKPSSLSSLFFTFFTFLVGRAGVEPAQDYSGRFTVC